MRLIEVFLNNLVEGLHLFPGVVGSRLSLDLRPVNVHLVPFDHFGFPISQENSLCRVGGHPVRDGTALLLNHSQMLDILSSLVE